MDEQTAVALIKALTAIWAAIRARHPEVPGVVLLPAPAPRGETNVLGHFAPLRWSGRKENGSDASVGAGPRRVVGAGQYVHEVVVVAEHLNRPAEDVLETLLHEAAHALNFTRGIKDCSATSQYHNHHFREAALEVGLAVERTLHYGFALTSLTKSTATRYGREVVELENVLVHRRSAARVMVPPSGGKEDNDQEGDNTSARGGSKEDDNQADDEGVQGTSRNRKAVCACPFIIRVSQKTIRDTVIRCESCGQPFRLA